MLTTAARNAMLDGFNGTHLSLHSAYSATGLNELTGGTPAYARRPVTYAAAAAEAKAASNQPLFDVPAAAVVRFIGRWTAITGGIFLGMTAAGGAEKQFSVDPATELIKSPAHGFLNDQRVVFYGGLAPTGLTEGTSYFVITATTDTFAVSLTQGGAAINITGDGAARCKVARIVEETFGGQGTYEVNPEILRLDI
ncbi:MAG: hypothetical protein ACRC2H_01195 [Silanimonas sp.]